MRVDGVLVRMYDTRLYHEVCVFNIFRIKLIKVCDAKFCKIPALPFEEQLLQGAIRSSLLGKRAPKSCGV